MTRSNKRPAVDAGIGRQLVFGHSWPGTTEAKR